MEGGEMKRVSKSSLKGTAGIGAASRGAALDLWTDSASNSARLVSERRNRAALSSSSSSSSSSSPFLALPPPSPAGSSSSSVVSSIGSIGRIPGITARQEHESWHPSLMRDRGFFETERKMFSSVRSHMQKKLVAVPHPFVADEVLLLNTLIAGCGSPEDMSKPSIVLIHGFASAIGYWALSIDELAASFRVYALDLPCFGFSSRAADPIPQSSGVYGYAQMAESQRAEMFFSRCLRSWKRKIGLEAEKVHVVGHSLGGYLAAAFALQFPNHVRALTLCDPWGIPEHPVRLRGPVVSLMLKGILESTQHLLRSRLFGRRHSDASSASREMPEIVNADPQSRLPSSLEPASSGHSDVAVLAGSMMSADPSTKQAPFLELLIRMAIRAFAVNSWTALSVLRQLSRPLGLRVLSFSLADMHDRYRNALHPSIYDSVSETASLVYAAATATATPTSAGTPRPTRKEREEKLQDSPILIYLYETNTIQPATGELLFNRLFTEHKDIEWADRPLVHRLHDLDPSIDATFIYGQTSWIRQIDAGVEAAKSIRGKVQVRVVPGGHQVIADNPNAFHAALLTLDSSQYAEIYAHDVALQ
eukprot:ANDGO_08246.mRNA.1 Abhydrolase domain-containing protein cgi-58